MMTSKKYLITEGLFDKQFLDALLPALGINDVNVITPNKSGSEYNGKGNAISLFTSSLLTIQSDSAERLALVIDADFTDISSQGFRKTLNFLVDKSRDKGFYIKTEPANYKNGILLKNDKCKVDVAVWIMPDNNLDGYLEYLLFNALDAVKHGITSEAIDIISKIKNKEYKDHHEMKAKLAIAMAMLENPGRNISHLTDKNKNILNCGNNEYLKGFTTFLYDYFK